MKSPLAALGLSLGLLALAGPASAQSAQAATNGPRVEAVYSAHARGMNVGDFTYTFSQNGQSYEVNAQRRLSGLARTLMGMSPCPVMNTTGRRTPSSSSFCWNSSPLMPGMRTSSTRQPGASGSGASMNAATES